MGKLLTEKYHKIEWPSDSAPMPTYYEVTFYSIDCDLCIMVFLNIITKRICYDQTATKIKQSLLSNRLSKWKRQEGMEQRREQFRVHHWVIEMMLSARIIVRWSCEIEMCWKETLASAREREQRRRKSTSTSLTRTHLSPATSVPSCSAVGTRSKDKAVRKN